MHVIKRRAARSVLVYAPSSFMSGWIEHELVETGLLVQCAPRMQHVIAALCDDPPPPPDVLVIDIDALRNAELERLEQARRRGWRGLMIGVGARMEVVDRCVAPPFRTGDLRFMLRDVLPNRGPTVHQHRTQRVSLLRDHVG
jgi:hypothetical protein